VTVVTRFAPSPTGMLHLGSARTALFNWLYARHHGGRYLLRVEDTDRKRSTPEALTAILEGLEWLGLIWDGDVFYQSKQLERHAEVAHALLQNGQAYHCYASPEELTEMRERARAERRTVRYDGRWRDRDPVDAPTGVKPVIRLKAPQQGETVIDDRVQGQVRVANDQLDDMILLRADGTPTYMLSVVVDDHDEGITHIIRGDDHLTNAARQSQLYSAMDWPIPIFAHISLIHGADGAKLSKRHGATGVAEFREMGYLPDALVNYLLRLGWGHGDDEIISREQAIKWFDFGGIGQSPARFDMAKLDNLNTHYLRETPDAALLDTVFEQLTAQLDGEISDDGRHRVTKGLTELKKRARTVKELVENARFYVESPRYPLADAKAAKLLNEETSSLLKRAKEALATVEDWSSSSLEEKLRSLAEDMGIGLGKIAQPMRAAVTGMNVSPGIFEVIEILGRDETLTRIDRAAERTI
jgi:glutamyl-tRNA synthetase